MASFRFLGICDLGLLLVAKHNKEVEKSLPHVVWFDSCTAADQREQQQVVKSPMYHQSETSEPEEIETSCCIQKALNIIRDQSHP